MRFLPKTQRHTPRYAIGKESNREFHKIEGREKDLITTGMSGWKLGTIVSKLVDFTYLRNVNNKLIYYQGLS